MSVHLDNKNDINWIIFTASDLLDPSAPRCLESHGGGDRS